MRLEEATVLVVDDEPELREIFSAWLGRRACHVLTAANGADALTLLESETVHVLVSDVRMPVMNGVELVRRLFADQIFIPSIIFVSGFGDVEPREMYGLGVEALIEKPLSRARLLQALDDSLLARDQLWQTPSAEPMQQRLTVSLPAFDAATAADQFCLGRGGCAFAYPTPLHEEKTIDLDLRFGDSGPSLHAQGRVEWYAQQDGHAGISFHYLDPACRDWVVRAMQNSACRSFIPPCRPTP